MPAVPIDRTVHSAPAPCQYQTSIGNKVGSGRVKSTRSCAPPAAPTRNAWSCVNQAGGCPVGRACACSSKMPASCCAGAKRGTTRRPRSQSAEVMMAVAAATSRSGYTSTARAWRGAAAHALIQGSFYPYHTLYQPYHIPILLCIEQRRHHCTIKLQTSKKWTQKYDPGCAGTSAVSAGCAPAVRPRTLARRGWPRGAPGAARRRAGAPGRTTRARPGPGRSAPGRRPGGPAAARSPAGR